MRYWLKPPGDLTKSFLFLSAGITKNYKCGRELCRMVHLPIQLISCQLCSTFSVDHNPAKEVILPCSALSEKLSFDCISFGIQVLQKYVLLIPLSSKTEVLNMRCWIYILPNSGSILDYQLDWESGKFQLARWSHEVVLKITGPPTHPPTQPKGGDKGPMGGDWRVIRDKNYGTKKN